MQSSKQLRVREYRICYVAAVRYHAMTNQISIHEAFKKSLHAFTGQQLPPFATFHAFENFNYRYRQAVDAMLQDWERSGDENDDYEPEIDLSSDSTVIGRDILSIFEQTDAVEMQSMSITSFERERLVDGLEQRGFLNRVLAFVPTLVQWVQNDEQFATKVCRFYAMHHYGGEGIPMYS